MSHWHQPQRPCSAEQQQQQQQAVLQKPLDLFKAIFEDQDSSEEDSEVDEPQSNPLPPSHPPSASVATSNGTPQQLVQPSAKLLPYGAAAQQQPHSAEDIQVQAKQLQHQEMPEKMSLIQQPAVVQQPAAVMQGSEQDVQPATAANVQAPPALQQQQQPGGHQPGPARHAKRQRSESDSESDHRKAKKKHKSKHESRDKHRKSKHSKKHKDDRKTGKVQGVTWQ